MSQSADAEDRINSMGREPPENAMRANVHLYVRITNKKRKREREREGGREGGRERERERER